MILPPRLPKKRKRESRWRSPTHCNFVRSFACSIGECTSGEPTEVAHVRLGSGAGMGQKPHDYFTLSLCRFHHAEQHRIGERSFEKLHGICMLSLAEEFSKASPKAREIYAAKIAN